MSAMRVNVIVFALVLGTLLACSSGGGNAGNAGNAGNTGNTAPSLVSIVVTPSSASVALGATQQFAAIGNYSDNSSQDLGTSTIWSSSNRAIATINSAGMASAVSTGTATIQATSGAIVGSTVLTVSSAITSSSTSTSASNSLDADSFLWGTEGNVNTADAGNLPSTAAAARDAINGTLKTKFVKFRISTAFFTSTDGGVTYSSSYCLPKAGQCSVSYNMDEVAKLYQANGWSMVPMLRTDETQTITTTVIDNYVNFVDWFLGRYKTTASIQMVELVNSPGARTWLGTDAQLVELTNKTYDRVKGKYPDVSVGTPGFEYWLDSAADPGGNSMTDNIAYFLNKNNGAKFDFWAFHGYALRPVSGSQVLPLYPPTKSPIINGYGGIPGILQIRAAMDANGWQDRKIIDTEHDNITATGQAITSSSDALDAAYVVQELTLKRTLMSNAIPVLSSALPLKMAPRGTIGEAGISSLNADGSVTLHVKAMALLWSKLKEYPYAGHISGAFDDENQAWVEKFASGKKELYIFFKPFKYQSGQNISLDGQTLNTTLNLSVVPSSAVITDVTGSTSVITPAQSLTLPAENSPKFLEVTYP
jgi:hypothetical protein